MLYCKECGASLPDETPPFCPVCGTIINATAQSPAPPQTAPSEPVPPEHTATGEALSDAGAPPAAPVRKSAPCAVLKPSQVRGKYPPPLSTVSLFWSLILLFLPAIGFVTAVIWASGGASNENRRNLGRAALLLRLLSLGILLTLYFSVHWFMSRYGMPGFLPGY